SGTPPSGVSAAIIGAGRVITINNTGGNMNNVVGPGTLRLTGNKAGQFLDVKGNATIEIDGGSVAAQPPVRMIAAAGETVTVLVKNEGSLRSTGGNAVKINVGNNDSGGTGV